MSIIGTFNNWNIVAVPSYPPPRTQQFTANDIVGMNVSPFTGQQQTLDWQSGWLEVQVSYQPLTRQQAQAWQAFLMQLRGQANVFQMGDALATSPQGSHPGTPLVNGANQTGYSLATDGWTANATNILLPGDWIQIGYRLYKVLDAANANASGQATLNLWPQLRESPADNTALTLTNTKGLFRLKGNARQWSLVEDKTCGIQFEAREAL
jgi:hypothetical protein